MTGDFDQGQEGSTQRSTTRNFSWSAEAFGEGGYEVFTPSPEQLANMLMDSFRRRPETLASLPTSVCALAKKVRMSRDRARRVIAALEKGGLRCRGARNTAEWFFDKK